MKVYNICCCVMLTIAITASYAEAESRLQEQKRGLVAKRNRGQVAKRDASILMDHFSIQNFLKYRPKFIYKRVPSQRRRSPRPTYGATRTKYTVKPSRKIMRRYRNSVNLKYGHPSHYKRPPKFRYAHQKSPSPKPLYDPFKKKANKTPEPIGFGEPPLDLLDYHILKHHDEPSAYQTVLKAASKDSSQSYPHVLSDPIDIDHIDYGDDIEKAWQPQSLTDRDAKFVPSYKQKAMAKSKIKTRPSNGQLPSELDNNSFDNFFNYDKQTKPDAYRRKKKQKRNEDQEETSKTADVTKSPESQIVVGGRYAEPPARYFPYYKRNTQEAADGSDFALPDDAVDPDVPSSATISPYVNYKNSNVAFSPQNLNDAFSIVD